MEKQHSYKATIKWTGNKGTGTDSYSSYERSHEIIIENKMDILGSSDPAFRGDKLKHNPEELFLSAIASCHMLWYLHLCSEAGIIITDYTDTAIGRMVETSNGGGKFIEVTLNPSVIVTDEQMVVKANALHKRANELCFIANSLNFPVKHHPTTSIHKQ
jgi:organic hydroperoxide reductase OsmC/OhrA